MVIHSHPIISLISDNYLRTRNKKEKVNEKENGNEREREKERENI